MGPSEEPPADIVPLLALERSRLLELLATIDEAEWQASSPCPGWSVLGLCCHLLGDDLSIISRHRDRYRGTSVPPGGDEPTFIAWLDELQTQWVHASRRLSPRVVVELLEWAGPQVIDALSTKDPRARTAYVTWAGIDPVPEWLNQVRELSEYWIHRQQLRQALGRASDLREDLFVPILDGLRWAYPFRLGQVEAEDGDTVTIELSGLAGATWYLVAGAAGWDFCPAPGSRRIAALAMTTEQAWRLLTNNLPAGGRSQLDLFGDERILEVLVRTRAIIGAPKPDD